jgi:hypothetical protein
MNRSRPQLVHDASRHVRGLRLSLAQDKAPLALLLAAGCPAGVKNAAGDPLIPAMAGMTAALRASLKTSEHQEAFRALLTCLAEDGKADPNVEDWLSAVRSLRAVATGGAVRGLSKEQLEKLEEAIAGGIVDLVECELPDETPFHAVAAWAAGLERELPVEVFTTNYDLLIEQAFESMRGPYFDGFVGVRRPFFDNASVLAATRPEIPPRFTRLWKLHGSVNWFLTDSGEVVRTPEAPGVRRLIHPSHLKYEESRQMPYLALLDRLRGYLTQRGALLVTCGYSYRDGHINSVIGEALGGNATASLIALMRSGSTSYPEATAMAAKHANMALFAKDGAVIGTRRGPWQCDAASSQLGIQLDGKSVEVTLGEFGQFGELLTGLLGRPRSEIDDR